MAPVSGSGAIYNPHPNSNHVAGEGLMKVLEEDETGPDSQSRRRLMTTSAALVAGSLAACNTVSGNDGSSEFARRSPAETTTLTLPDFDAQRCTDQLITELGPEEQRFIAWNEALRDSAAGRESAFVDLDAVGS